MLDLLGNTEALAKTLTAVAAAVGVLYAFLRWMRPRWRDVRADIRAGRDALVGRPAIVDSITGAELAPALPGMGVRMDTNEKQLATLTEAVVALADVHVRINDHERRIGVNERRLDILEAGGPTVVVQQNVHPQEPLPGLGEN